MFSDLTVKANLEVAAKVSVTGSQESEPVNRVYKLTKIDYIFRSALTSSSKFFVKKMGVCMTITKSTRASGESVLISGFGKFEIKDKNPRKGRNQQTGADQMLGGRRVVTFKCSSVLREKIYNSD